MALARYSLEQGIVWRVSSLAFLLLICVVALAQFRDTADRHVLVSQIKAEPMALVFLIFLEVAVQGPLVLVLFGVFAGSSPALYATALIVNLLQVSFMLGRLVLSGPDTAA